MTVRTVDDCSTATISTCAPGIAKDFFLMAGSVIAIAVASIMTWGVGLAIADRWPSGVTALVYSQSVPANLRDSGNSSSRESVPGCSRVGGSRRRMTGAGPGR